MRIVERAVMMVMVMATMMCVNRNYGTAMDWTVSVISASIYVYFALIKLAMWMALTVLWPRNCWVTGGKRCDPVDGCQVQLAGRLAA